MKKLKKIVIILSVVVTVFIFSCVSVFAVAPDFNLQDGLVVKNLEYGMDGPPVNLPQSPYPDYLGQYRVALDGTGFQVRLWSNDGWINQATRYIKFDIVLPNKPNNYNLRLDILDEYQFEPLFFYVDYSSIVCGDNVGYVGHADSEVPGIFFNIDSVYGGSTVSVCMYFKVFDSPNDTFIFTFNILDFSISESDIFVPSNVDNDIGNLNNVEQDLMNSTEQGRDSVVEMFSNNPFTRFGNSLGFISSMFSSMISKFDVLYYILLVSLTLGMIIFVFNIIPSVDSKIRREKSKRSSKKGGG